MGIKTFHSNMILELNIKNTENLGEITEEKRSRISEVVNALVASGGLTGVKGGQTIIHFDGDGNFQGVQLSYWPYRRRKN